MKVPLPLIREPYTRVDQILGNLRDLDDAMSLNGDLRAVFLIAYQHITEHVLHALPSGRFEDPTWVAAFTLDFANRYRAALVAWEDGALEDVPAEWQLAFAHAAAADGIVVQHLLLGMTAHILYDLPMAVATTVGGRDSTGCLRDPLRVLSLLHQTVDLIQDDLGERYGPGLSVLDYALLRFDEWAAYLLVKYYRRVAWDAAVGYLSQGVDDDEHRAHMKEVALRSAERVMQLTAGPRRLQWWRRLEAFDPSRLPYVGWLYPGTRRDTRVTREGNTLTLCFTRYLPQSPEQLFPLLTEPELMNLWSEAKVRLVSPGDGGGAADVGAVRVVRVPVPGPPILLDEVTEVCEPPHRYVYRVTRCDQLGHHRGTMTLRPGGRGTQVRWEVRIEAPTAVQAAIMRQILVPKLQASLDILEQIATDAPWRSTPKAVADGQGDEELAGLVLLERAVRQQGRRAGELLAQARRAKHGSRWFLQVVEAAADRIARAAHDGHWTHATWVLRCWLATQAPVLAHLDVYFSGATVEDAAWRERFGALEQLSAGRRSRSSWPAVSAVLHQQLVSDYPTAVTSSWLQHYEGRCSPVRFRADELALSELIAELLWTLARGNLGLSGMAMRAAERVLRPETIRRGREQLLAGYAKARRAAFEDAIATLGVGG